ncbi:hypothetical protein [Tolumonas lignilytica]|uniref:hypothetical protein n=1 Tax=Tolumonas lignilytica TaxID=1283284 RepID=UPI0004665696|nr:hypothetical protein [Tolumonas lignilytica]
MIDWISVDDVLYQWNGQEIVCDTGVGYSVHMDSNHLDGLEINGNTDHVIGRLTVDFITGNLTYEPYEGQPITGSLQYSMDGHVMGVSLSQLPVTSTLSDIVGTENDDTDIWLSIAHTSQVQPSVQSDHIDHSAVLDSGENTLDLILQNIDGAEHNMSPSSVQPSTLADNHDWGINAEVPDPLDTLHFLNSGIHS